MDLKVLVWDGSFGADVKEMRMPLPDLYPSSNTPYDQNEDVAARTLGEAIVSRFLSCQPSSNEGQTHSPVQTNRSIPWFLPDQPNLNLVCMSALLPLVPNKGGWRYFIHPTLPRFDNLSCVFLALLRVNRDAVVLNFPLTNHRARGGRPCCILAPASAPRSLTYQPAALTCPCPNYGSVRGVRLCACACTTRPSATERPRL